MEQTRSSSETKPIIDATPFENRESENDANMINPAIVIKKHLTEIYQRLNQIEAKMEKLTEATNQKIDTLERTKLSAQEFRQFVDTLNRTLMETLLTVATVDSSARSLPTKKETGQGGAAISQRTELDKTQKREAATPHQQHPDQTRFERRTHRLHFPLKTNGEIFYVGNGVTAVVGDALIPSRAKVDESLVIKGTLRTGEACTLLKDVKALRNIAIGRDSIVEGNLVSGGKIFLGLNCQVKGTVQGEIQEVSNASAKII